MTEKSDDKINPAHYKPVVKTDRTIKLSDLQVIDIIEMFGLGYCLGNVLKYVLRAGKKKELGYENYVKQLEDLRKASWYLNREIFQLEEYSPEKDGAA